MPACTICSRPDVASLDADLAAGLPYRTIEARYSVSHGALSRHKAHMDQAASAVVHDAGAVVHAPQPVDHAPASLVRELLQPVLSDPIEPLFTYADEAAYQADVTAKTTALATADTASRDAWTALVAAARALAPFVALEHCGLLVSRDVGMGQVRDEWRRLPQPLQHREVAELTAQIAAFSSARAAVEQATQEWYAQLVALDTARKQLQAAHTAWQQDQARRRYLATPDGQEWQRDYERISRQLQLADPVHDRALLDLRTRQHRQLRERFGAAVSRLARPVVVPAPEPTPREIAPGQETFLEGPRVPTDVYVSPPG